MGSAAGSGLSTAVQDVNELKQRLIDSWSSIQQTVINEAIDQW